jgi:hypothetical protein
MSVTAVLLLISHDIRRSCGSTPVYIVAGLIVTALVAAGWTARTAAERREARTSHSAVRLRP